MYEHAGLFSAVVECISAQAAGGCLRALCRMDPTKILLSRVVIIRPFALDLVCDKFLNSLSQHPKCERSCPRSFLVSSCSELCSNTLTAIGPYIDCMAESARLNRPR